jgi:hypothetical protein
MNGKREYRLASRRLGGGTPKNFAEKNRCKVHDDDDDEDKDEYDDDNDDDG